MPNISKTLCRLTAALCVAAALSVPAVQAQGAAKILIVNSDAAVEKYRQVENVFRAQIGPNTARVAGIALQPSQTPEDVEKLLHDEDPALIYCIGSKAYQLAAQFSGDKPLLFSSVINWQRFGRGGRHYGIANELSLAQELSLMRYVLPGLRRVGVLYSPEYNRERVAEAQSYAAEVGLTVIGQTIDDSTNLDAALEALLPQIDVLWLIADPVVLADREAVESIFASSENRRKPVYTYSDAYLSYGASLVVAADTPTIGRQAANLAQALLHKETPAEAVQTPAGSHITLNLCQLGKLKAEYNAEALDSVNRLLECDS